MSFIPYESRAGEEGFFEPVEMSTLEIFTEITAFKHGYYLNNGDPTFRDYFLYAGSATGKLLLDQPGMFGDFEGTLEHWQDELRRLGPELDIYAFSYLYDAKRQRDNGKPERGFVVYAESRRHRAQVFYVPMFDAEEVVAAGAKVHPMYKTWMPGRVYSIDNPKGWFLLNDVDGNPIESPKLPEPKFVSFGPTELALRNLGNVLFKSTDPFRAALILSFEGAGDKHVLVESDSVEGLHERVWDALHDQAESSQTFRGYSFAVDAFLTGEAKERNQVYLVQSEYRVGPATLKAYMMNKIVFGGQPIALMQDMNGPLFERAPVRTLYVQGE
jgi:hypothetical protein